MGTDDEGAEVLARRPVTHNQLLDRVVGLLTVLSQADRPMPAAQLARRAGLPLSTTYRLAQDLERHGLVTPANRDGLSLGLRAVDFAGTVETRIEATLVAPARDVMRELASEHGETAILTAPTGTFAIGLAAIESPVHAVRLSHGRRRAQPMHLGASGKVLLAFLDAPDAEDVLVAAEGSRHADGTRVDVAELRRQLAAARRDGYVVSDGELDEGATAAAAPILDARGRLAAALSLGGPTPRIRPKLDTIVPAVVAGARTIAARLERR
jgi:DNA-binding IclR family transcriptional regulator